MSERWSIKTDWALLESSSPEERAGFAALSITAHGTCLTQGLDRLLQSVRDAPFLSAYHLAEWLAWNWWRLRWEPARPSSVEWRLSHAMASIGHGYIWPDIDILSDGQNVTLVSKSTPERERTPYRYLNNVVSSIPGSDFENEVERFIETVLQRLEDRRVARSNLADIWQSVAEERQDAVSRQKRKLEALLGEDPGEMDEISLRRLLEASALTGPAALEEIAANRTPGRDVPDIGSLVEYARREGIRTRPGAGIPANPIAAENMRENWAWQVGVDAARSLRAHLKLGADQAIPNRSLADYCGAPDSVLEARKDSSPLDFSFSLIEPNEPGRVLLRSRWETGRRFELARLLGDWMVYASADPVLLGVRSQNLFTILRFLPDTSRDEENALSKRHQSSQIQRNRAAVAQHPT